MDSGAFGEGQGRARQGQKAKGSKDSKDSETRTRTPLNVGNVESAVTTTGRIVGASRTGPTMVVQRERT